MCRGLVSIRVNCKASVTVFPATDVNVPVCGELRNSAGWRKEGHDIKKWMHISKAFQGRQRVALCTPNFHRLCLLSCRLLCGYVAQRSQLPFPAHCQGVMTSATAHSSPPLLFLPLCAGLERNTRAFPGGSDWKESACNEGDPGLTPEWGRSPAKGNGNPLQYSCLEKSMDREAWLATIHGVAKSQTG